MYDRLKLRGQNDPKRHYHTLHKVWVLRYDTAFLVCNDIRGPPNDSPNGLRGSLSLEHEHVSRALRKSDFSMWLSSWITTIMQQLSVPGDLTVRGRWWDATITMVTTIIGADSAAANGVTMSNQARAATGALVDTRVLSRWQEKTKNITNCYVRLSSRHATGLEIEEKNHSRT